MLGNLKCFKNKLKEAYAMRHTYPFSFAFIKYSSRILLSCIIIILLISLISVYLITHIAQLTATDLALSKPIACVMIVLILCAYYQLTYIFRKAIHKEYTFICYVFKRIPEDMDWKRVP